jgi:hypothetical protein
MSFFEHYAMGIPVLVPTPEFLWELHDQYDMVTERTWHRVRRGTRPSSSVIGAAECCIGVPDPNNDLDKAAFLHWGKNILPFLVVLWGCLILCAGELRDMSLNMAL